MASAFPTLQLLIALVESRTPCPIRVGHAVWFSEGGDVEGHFYMPDKRTEMATSGALHYSVCWPPSKNAATERGDDRLTRRRRQRRGVFEAFTAAVQAGANQQKKTVSNLVPSGIVAILVHPPSSCAENATSVDYLDAQRLQQFCDLPPPAWNEGAASRGQLPSANPDVHNRQECILIRFPQEVAPHYKLTAAYLSCHGLNGTIASELQQSKFTLAASDGTPSPVVVDGAQSTAQEAANLATRTATVISVPMPTGTCRRLAEIGSICARSFPMEWWGPTTTARERQDFFLKQRLSLFLLVEYDTEVRHVSRFSLMCVTSAPRLPPLKYLNHPAESVVKNDATGSQWGTADSLKRAGSHESEDDISWTAQQDASRRLGEAESSKSPSRVKNGGGIVNHTNASGVVEFDREAHARWTFVRDSSLADEAKQKRALSSSNPFASFSPQRDKDSKSRLKASVVEADRRSRACSPGGFLIPSVLEREKGPQGRYDHDKDPSNRSVLVKAIRAPWQKYNLQRYDEADNSATKDDLTPRMRSVEDTKRRRHEHEVELLSYLSAQRDGSLLGYLVDGPCPIARVEHIKPPTAAMPPEHRDDVGRLDTNHYHSVSTACISSQTLKLLQTSERNDVQIRTADPFLRFRKTLAPTIERRPHYCNSKKVVPQHGAPNVVDVSVIHVVEHGDSSPLSSKPTPSELSLRGNQKLRPARDRRNFLDRFMYVVHKLENDGGQPRGHTDGDGSVSSNGQLIDNSAGRRPSPLAVNFGTTGPTTWSPQWSTSRTTPQLGSTRAEGGREKHNRDNMGVSPRTSLRQTLFLDVITQAMDDFFYSVYSLHGGESSRNMTLQVQQQLGVPVTTKLSLVRNVSADLAIEVVHLVDAHLRLGEVSVMVREKEVSITPDVASSPNRASPPPSSDELEAPGNDAPGDPKNMGGIALQVSSLERSREAHCDLECTVDVRVINDYAALRKIRSTFEQDASRLSSRLVSRPLPLTEILRDRIHKRNEFARAAVTEAFEARKHELAVEAAATTSSPNYASAQPSRLPASRGARQNTSGMMATTANQSVDLTHLFKASASSLSINAWMMTEA